MAMAEAVAVTVQLDTAALAALEQRLRVEMAQVLRRFADQETSFLVQLRLRQVADVVEKGE